MSRHQNIHANSRAAHDAGQSKFGQREAAILDWIDEHGAASDRQVMNGLGFTDMNAVRPRITELVNAIPPVLKEAGNIVDPITKRTVRTVDLAHRVKDQKELFAWPT